MEKVPCNEYGRSQLHGTNTCILRTGYASRGRATGRYRSLETQMTQNAYQARPAPSVPSQSERRLASCRAVHDYMWIIFGAF